MIVLYCIQRQLIVNTFYLAEDVLAGYVYNVLFYTGRGVDQWLSWTGGALDKRPSWGSWLEVWSLTQDQALDTRVAQLLGNVVFCVGIWIYI